ncbi:hypothetical protein [Gordonia liuliyuniae]|uniref:Uncharacterized protein n=1 Tax=Gordonia liuliyuniae TaxID=2911517 RepID=A0ABS9ITZ2_9ACTN|nr:hypothetical protein [Gordonia liuliyuniae]MCF8589023.1 hypothetical protein [Gordonia liuliyuniae]
MNDVRFDDATDDPTDAWLVDAVRDEREPDSDVERLISSISSGLSRMRRPARTLATDTDGVWVSDRIVKQLIAVSVRRALGRLVVFASIDGTDDTADGVRIGVIARYADDLPATSEKVRDVVDEVLISTIGARSSAVARTEVTVRWQDLYTREWLG